MKSRATVRSRGEAGRRAATGRLVTALAVLGSVIAVPAASADHAVRKSCTFADDGRGVIEENFRRPTHNVIGAGIRSDDRNVTVDIYVGGLPASPPEPEDAFIDYTFSFNINDQRLFFKVPADASRPASYGVSGVALGQPSVERDAQIGQIRITAPLAGFAPLASPSPGDLATSMTATTTLTVVNLDIAQGGSTAYRFGLPSCPRKKK